MKAGFYQKRAARRKQRGRKADIIPVDRDRENAGQSIAEINSQGMLSGICISTAGMVDCKQGKILYSGELIPDYTGTEIKRHWKINFMFHVQWKTMSIVQDLPNW